MSGVLPKGISKTWSCVEIAQSLHGTTRMTIQSVDGCKIINAIGKEYLLETPNKPISCFPH